MAIWLTLSAAILLGAYLCGSIPTGYIAAKILKGIDIREHGSGSTGATNVLRTLGKGPGLLVLVIDTLKGVGAIAQGLSLEFSTHWLLLLNQSHVPEYQSL